MRILVALSSLLIVLALASGCAKKESSSSATQSSAETATPSAAPPAAGEGNVAGEGERVSTEGSAGEIMARVDQEETELGKIIGDAQLKAVHLKAFAIRDLVAAAAGKAAITGADKAKLDEHVSKIKSLASELDESGDAGNLSKTKAEFVDFRVELQAIRQLLGSHQ